MRSGSRQGFSGSLLRSCFLVAALAASAAAQQVPPSARPTTPSQTIEQEQRPTRPDMTPRPPAVIETPERPAAIPAEAEGPRALIRTFRITGNQVISTKTLEALVRPEEGKALTLEEMRALAARISDYYAQQGYLLARAYLPPQDIRQETLEIAVLEGDVGEVDVTGNEYYTKEAILSALGRFRRRGVIHEGLLETAINELNDYPGLNVRASLKPGEQRGKTDVILTAQERPRFTFAADVDNYGSKYSGIWRFGTELSYGGITGLGDKLTLRGIGSDERLGYFRGSYLTPVGGYGTKLGLSYTQSENTVGEEFASLNAVGFLQAGSLDITQTVFRTSAANLQLFGGVDIKSVENDVLGLRSGQDDLRVFRLGFSGDYRDRFLGRSYYGFTWHQGVPWFGGNEQNDPGATRNDNPGSYSKWTFDLARIQSLLYGGAYVVLRGFAQLSSQNLQSVEQYSIGGYYTVRGYPLAERGGDQGYALSAEVVAPVPYLQEYLQAAAFVDHGGVFPVSPNKRGGEKEHFLSGIGLGLRANVRLPGAFGGTLQLRLDYGFAVGPEPTTTTNRLIHVDRGILYFSSSVRF